MKKGETMRIPIIRCARCLRRSEGSSLIELALLLPMFLFLFVGAVDLGRLYYVSVEVTGASQAGALYGVQNPSDVSGMESASSAGASNLSGVTTNATYGCECSDGTAASANCSLTPSCTYNYVNYVDVVTSAQYAPIFNYPGLPASMSVSRETRMRVGSD
jgi:Flp pilus assembly protein TadG